MLRLKILFHLILFPVSCVAVSESFFLVVGCLLLLFKLSFQGVLFKPTLLLRLFQLVVFRKLKIFRTVVNNNKYRRVSWQKTKNFCGKLSKEKKVRPIEVTLDFNGYLKLFFCFFFTNIVTIYAMGNKSNVRKCFKFVNFFAFSFPFYFLSLLWEKSFCQQLKSVKKCTYNSF